MSVHRRSVSAVVAVFAAALGFGVAAIAPAGAASAYPITGPQDGVLDVQLVPVAGHPSLAGVGIVVENENFQDTTAMTNAAGLATLTGLNTAGGTYTVAITSVPDAGTATIDPVVATDSVPVTATPTTFDLSVGIGGTLTGLLTDHTGAPLAGADVTAYQNGSWDTSMSATTDASGRYTISGLEPGVIRLDTLETAGTGASPGDRPIEWLGWSVAQTASSSAETRPVATQLVHTSYDMQVAVESLRGDGPVSGAIVRLTNTATGATFDERTDFTLHADHLASFDVPSGDYTVSLVTRATADAPSATWWLPTSSTYLTQNASEAGTFAVRYGADDFASRYFEAVLLAP
jgi:hypothetical protein